MKAKKHLLWGVLIAVLAQSSVLGWMIYSQVNLLRTGREIVLPVIPVDPRSLFRGDYVRLSYPISRVPQALFSADRPRGTIPVYVTLKKESKADKANKADNEGNEDKSDKDSKGSWTPIAVRTYFEPALDDNHIVLKAHIKGRRGSAWRRANVNSQLRLRYGIESYFVEEGAGLKLEKLVSSKKLSILVAVGASGQAAIKGLLVDGVLQYKEPLF